MLMMLGFGIGFEFPVFLVVLQLVGVLTPQQLAGARRFAIVGIVVVVAVATPSGDPYSLLASVDPADPLLRGVDRDREAGAQAPHSECTGARATTVDSGALRASVPRRVRLRARSTSSSRARRARRRPVGARRRADGSGKTVVAEYAIALALAEGRQGVLHRADQGTVEPEVRATSCAGTAPTKVGLLTGDNAINGDAPVVVMTTEVLRNMIYAGSGALRDLRYVVLDEVHYLQDAYRGPVWEEVIIHLPHRRASCACRPPCRTRRSSRTGSAPSGARPRRSSKNGVRSSSRTSTWSATAPPIGSTCCRPSSTADPTRRPLASTPRRSDAVAAAGAARAGGSYTPRRVEVVELLEDQRHAPGDLLHLQPRRVRRRGGRVRRRRAAAHRPRESGIASARSSATRLRGSTDADLEVLGYDRVARRSRSGRRAPPRGHGAAVQGSGRGVLRRGPRQGRVRDRDARARHQHAGAHGRDREAHEVHGRAARVPDPGEYTQLTGRAGRRGIDTVGYAIVLWSPFVPFDQVAGLASSRTFRLTSAFRPHTTWPRTSCARTRAEQAHHLLNLSFAQYQADRDVVRLEARLDRQARRARVRCARASAKPMATSRSTGTRGRGESAGPRAPHLIRSRRRWRG